MLWLCPCRRPVLCPQVCCAACLCCSQQQPVAGLSVGEQLVLVNAELKAVTPEVDAAEKRLLGEPGNAVYQHLYNNRFEQQKKLSERVGTLEAQLSAGRSCADALVRPPACAPACPCAHLPFRPPAQPCDAAL